MAARSLEVEGQSFGGGLTARRWLTNPMGELELLSAILREAGNLTRGS
jgi:hypothetical protein